MIRLPTDRVAELRPKLQGHRVCVTGGAGFIGGHLLDALLSLGAQLSVIDDLSNSTPEHVGGLMEMEPERLRFIHGSILDEHALSDALEGVDTVFHLAALSSVPRSIAEPERTFAVNAQGTLRVLQAARKRGVHRVIYSASSSAYGANERLPKVETDIPEPMSPYAVSKLAGEHLMTAWSKSYGLSTISLRYFNIFGPRQPADSAYAGVIAAFAKRLINGQTPLIYGDGLASRDYTFVANAVLANLLAAASSRSFMGEVVNIGCGESTDLVQLSRKMGERLAIMNAAGNAASTGGNGKAEYLGMKPTFQPARVGDVRHSLADTTLARSLLGYTPFVGLEEGLDLTLNWYKKMYARETHGQEQSRHGSGS